MLSAFLLLLTTGGLCNYTRRGQSTGKCFLTIYTNSVLHLYISDFVILLILVSSKLFTNFVGAVSEFLMYLQTQHHAVNFRILSSQKWPQIWRAWESLPAFSETFTLNVGSHIYGSHQMVGLPVDYVRMWKLNWRRGFNDRKILLNIRVGLNSFILLLTF